MKQNYQMLADNTKYQKMKPFYENVVVKVREAIINRINGHGK